MAVFARLPETERPRINTDGTALAAKIRVEGEQILAVIPLDEPNARPIPIARDGEFDQLDDFRTINWEWIDPDNLLIWVASRHRSRRTTRRCHAGSSPTTAARGATTQLGWQGTFVFGSDVLWRSTLGTAPDPARPARRRPRLRAARQRGGDRGRRHHRPPPRGRCRRNAACRTGMPTAQGRLRLGTSFDRRNRPAPRPLQPGRQPQSSDDHPRADGALRRPAGAAGLPARRESAGRQPPRGLSRDLRDGPPDDGVRPPGLRRRRLRRRTRAAFSPTTRWTRSTASW